LTLSAQGEDLILSFGDGDKINIRNGLNYDYHFDKYIFSDTTLTFAQLINGRSFNLSAGDDDVSFGGLPSNIAVSVFAGGGNDVVTGASGRGNSIDGGDGNDELAGISYQAADTLIGGTGNDNLISGASGATLFGCTGSDTFVLSHSLQYGSDWIGDFASMNDHIRIDQQKLPVGNGNSALDGAVSRVAPGGFAASAELVIFASDISGNITASRAAAQIGGANDAYTSGQTALFVVDNGQDSAVYYFKSAGNDALVSSSELTLLATLGGTPATNVSDYLFGS
jgi:Ca2+-binding RTX toxin-like protein